MHHLCLLPCIGLLENIVRFPDDLDQKTWFPAVLKSNIQRVLTVFWEVLLGYRSLNRKSPTCFLPYCSFLRWNQRLTLALIQEVCLLLWCMANMYTPRLSPWGTSKTGRPCFQDIPSVGMVMAPWGSVDSHISLKPEVQHFCKGGKLWPFLGRGGGVHLHIRT